MYAFLVIFWMQTQFQRVSTLNCGDILSNSDGWFTSPDTDEDGYYNFGADCTWVITAPENKVIHIQFQEFDVEEGLKCMYDYLRIRDGNTKVGHYCGDTLPPDFVSTAKLVFVDFHSDYFINNKGFNATYKQSDDPTCGYRTWSLAGRFGSIDTEMHEDCTWIISNQKHIPVMQIYVAKLNITRNDSCELNFLEVYNDEIVFDRFCGEGEIGPQTYISSVLHMRLRSQGNIDFLVYFCPTDASGQWGGILTDMTGYITATDSDKNGLYDNNANTIWTLVAAVGYIIYLDIYYIHIHIHSGLDSCSGDMLKIYDGVFEPGTEIDTICGYNLPAREIWSTTNVLYLHFLTNAMYSGGGFNASYSHFLQGLSVKNKTSLRGPVGSKVENWYRILLWEAGFIPGENTVSNTRYTTTDDLTTSTEGQTTVSADGRHKVLQDYISSTVSTKVMSTEGVSIKLGDVNASCFTKSSNTFMLIAFIYVFFSDD